MACSFISLFRNFLTFSLCIKWELKRNNGQLRTNSNYLLRCRNVKIKFQFLWNWKVFLNLATLWQAWTAFTSSLSFFNVSASPSHCNLISKFILTAFLLCFVTKSLMLTCGWMNAKTQFKHFERIHWLSLALGGCSSWLNAWFHLRGQNMLLNLCVVNQFPM